MTVAFAKPSVNIRDWRRFPRDAGGRLRPAQGFAILSGMVAIDPEKRKELRQKLLDHLEAATAITDELGDKVAGYLVERAMDEVRASHWPELDPNVELFRKGGKSR